VRTYLSRYATEIHLEPHPRHPPGKEQPYDYCCHDGERSIGRVYRYHLSGWFWAMNAGGPDISRTRWATSGVLDTKDEAASMVERCYDACRDVSDNERR